MMTVLPTPAPPYAPTFPPRVNGQMRSMTLTPVSSIWVCVPCSWKDGASRWMGHLSSAATSPRPSKGSPVTLNRRPREAGPTGTAMGLPLSTTSAPRVSPSVAPMARQRTQLLPTCCSTSKMSFSSLSSISKPLNRSGISSGGNSTSTTVPIIWMTFPLVPSAISSLRL